MIWMIWFTIGFITGWLITYTYFTYQNNKKYTSLKKEKEEKYLEEYWWNDGKKPDLKSDI